jgi:hypothetical protein
MAVAPGIGQILRHGGARMTDLKRLQQAMNAGDVLVIAEELFNKPASVIPDKSRPTYKIKVTYRDGTGHTYANCTRSEAERLTAAQFRLGLMRPETVTVTTNR